MKHDAQVCADFHPKPPTQRGSYPKVVSQRTRHTQQFSPSHVSQAQNQFARSTSDSDETSAVPKNGSFSSSSLNCRIVSRGCLPNLTKHWKPTRSSPEGISFRLILHVRRFANQYTHNLSRLRAVNRRKPPNTNSGATPRVTVHVPGTRPRLLHRLSSPPYETQKSDYLNPLSAFYATLRSRCIPDTCVSY